MNSSSPGNFTIIAGAVRFAAYIEERHSALLDVTVGLREELINESPYKDYTAPIIDDAFYDAGTWLVSTATMYNLFGEHMAGFDVESIWPTIFTNQMQQSELSTLDEVADANKVEERITLPSFQATMRNINAVGSSTFIIGKVQIERQRIKMLAAFSAEEKLSTLYLLSDATQVYLNYHKDVITTYAYNLKLYYTLKTITDARSYRFTVRDVLWSFTILDFERSALAAMRKEARYTKVAIPRSRSDLSKALLIGSYTATGAVIGGPLGGTIGFVIGVAITLFE